MMGDRFHLTDEQFTEALLGSRSASVREHLGSCAQCAAEATRVRSAVGDFRQQSKLWAERRAATLPITNTARQREHVWSRRIPVWAAATVAVALAAGAGVGIRRERSAAADSQVAQTQVALPVSQATLKADNDLLSVIAGELQVDDSPSSSAYGLNSSSRADRPKSAAKRIVTE